MDTSKAKFVLHSYRSGGADDRDPQFAEALRLVAADRDLRDWLEAEQAGDEAIRAKLAEVPVPESLREALLVSRPASIPTRRLSPALAWAAALILLGLVAAISFGWANRPGSLAGYRAGMVESLMTPFGFDHAGANSADHQNWLVRERSLPGFSLPVGLQERPALGCRTLRWRGRPVGMICFGGRGQQVVHLFIVPRSAITDAPPGEKPEFAAVEGWTTASWSSGNVVYLMASQQDVGALEKLL